MRRALPIALLLLAAAGCLEPPISESVGVHMEKDRSARVAVTVALRDPSDYDRAPKVRQRVEDEARALEQGADAWTARLQGASPSRERTTFERERGTLRKVEREVQLDDPADLTALFRDVGIQMSYAEGEGWAELAIVPGASRRATSAQRQTVRSEVARFSEAAAAYVEATSELYAYLDRDPSRARACLGNIVSEMPEGESLHAGEEPLVGAVEDAVSALGAVLQIAPDEALTLDELSGLVYDPFPARMGFSVPGRVLDREGFPGPALSIPPLTLWSAYGRLSGRWTEPDLAIEMWKHDLEGGGRPLDVDRLAAMPRRAGPAPSAAEVRRAIESELTPAPIYRVRWER